MVSPCRGHLRCYSTLQSASLRIYNKGNACRTKTRTKKKTRYNSYKIPSMTYDTRRDAHPTLARRGYTGWGIRSRPARRSACASARRKGSRTACAPSPAALLPAASSSPTVWMQTEGLCRQEAGRHQGGGGLDIQEAGRLTIRVWMQVEGLHIQEAGRVLVRYTKQINKLHH